MGRDFHYRITDTYPDVDYEYQCGEELHQSDFQLSRHNSILAESATWSSSDLSIEISRLADLLVSTIKIEVQRLDNELNVYSSGDIAEALMIYSMLISRMGKDDYVMFSYR